MERNRFKRAGLYRAMDSLRIALPVLLFMLALLLMSRGLSRVDGLTEAESIRRGEAALSRAVTACYALEGRYPPDVDYLRRHYGLMIDEARYIVHYNRFADNLPPEMWVQARYF